MKGWTEAALEFSGIPEKVVRGTLLKLAERIIKRSPVGNPSTWKKPRKGYVGGRFRNNWQASVNAINTSASEPIDRSGSASMAKAKRVTDSLEIGATFYLSNNLPYAQRLEYGWSGQAPSGMIRLSVAELQARMNEANK